MRETILSIKPCVASFHRLTTTAILSTLVVAGFATSASAQVAKDPSKISVIGHRGARGARPENTIPAFTYAIEHGVNGVEFDLQMTKDGVIVVSHDPVLYAPVCHGPKERGVIHEMTLAEVKEWDCGSVKNPQMPNQVPVPDAKVPTFDEVLDLASKGNFIFIAEAKIVEKRMSEEEARTWLKQSGMHLPEGQMNSIIQILTMPGPEMVPPPDQWAAAILERIRAHHLESRVVFLSLDPRTVTAMHKIAPPDLRLMAGGPLDIEKIKAQGASEIVTGVNVLTPENVKAAQAAGIKLVPFSTRKEEWQHLVDLGVDRIITDDPIDLMEFLHKSK
jgi:glycerophosphoryl diester phosphodiesterase